LELEPAHHLSHVGSVTQRDGARSPGAAQATSNLSIVDHSGPNRSVGLFSETENTATIAGLMLTNLKYYAKFSYSAEVGGLVGQNGGLIANDYASGSIHGPQTWVGGLVGDNYGLISSSHASVGIPDVSFEAGGLAGENDGTIELSSADGSVQAYENGGGLVGLNWGLISESFASGKISCGARCKGRDVGGLAGINFDDIENSYATGSATAKNVQAAAAVGGLIGYNENDSSVSYSYSAGFVHSDDKAVGGFIGIDSVLSDLASSYWNTTTSKTSQGTGEGNVNGLTGLTSIQLKSGLPAGFDPTIWREKKGVNHGFPYLINNPPPKD
jgi:hypothetical protein